MEYFRQRFLDELNEEGDIKIRGLRWSRQQVLEGLDPDGYIQVFIEWVDDAKQAAKERARQFLTDNGGLPRFRALTQRFRNGAVLPFVGAGMSLASGFKPWGTFLLSLLVDLPHLKSDIERLLREGLYEEAAERIQNELRGAFNEEIHSHLGSHCRNVAGPVQLMPVLFEQEVITTNFDYVLTHVYRNAGKAFPIEYSGSRLADARSRIANNPHCLLRLHGEADSSDGRVLTRTEYEAAYNGRTTLTAILNVLLGSRSLLFMGCSLQADRTINALREIRSNAPDTPVRHYAFLPCPPEAERPERRAFLADAEIHPIYYPPDDHDQSIEDLLISLMEGGLDG
ncbi:SIR2 family protein [Methylocystis iwaonis]|uniref:SIR2-like domain-containing protein n=1 Tax=Methylocystis iwaonis TaxID=2885079 RepID=A0ABM8ECP7_9HYPH|nr:SIR2 family protein [Methylocystis iwaonis]BDV35766.1 hypothetical protein SS37A_32950 [Methylocystis iwaonis]